MRNEPPPSAPAPSVYFPHLPLPRSHLLLPTSPGGAGLVRGGRDGGGRVVPRGLARGGPCPGRPRGSAPTQASALRGRRACQGAAWRRSPATGVVGPPRVRHTPRPTCAPSQRPSPTFGRAARSAQGRRGEGPRASRPSRQCSAPALKRSPEHLEMQDRYREPFAAFSFPPHPFPARSEISGALGERR